MNPERHDRKRARLGWWMPAILLVCVLVTLSLAVHLPVAQRHVLEYGRNYLRANLGLDVEVQDLDYNLFTLSFFLRGVTVRRHDRENLPPFLTTEEIYLKLRFSDLIAGRLTMEQGRVDGAAFRIVVDEGGNSNLFTETRNEAPPASRQDERGLPLFIEEFQARGSVIEVDDRERQLRVLIPQWNLNISGDRTTGQETILLASDRSGLISFQARELPLSQLAVDLVSLDEELQLRRAGMRLGNTDILAAGDFGDLAGSTFDLMVNANVDLRDVARIASLQQQLEGQVDVQASIGQSLEDLEIAGTLAGENLVWEDFENVRLSARPSWNRRDQELTLKDVVLISSAGSFQGRTSLSLGETSETSALRGRFENLGLARLTRRLNLPIQIDSLAVGEVDLQWPGLEVQQLHGQAAVQLRAVSEQPSKDLLPVSGSLSLEKRGDRTSISLASLRAVNMELFGEVGLHSLSQVSGELRGNIAQVADTVSAVEHFLGMSGGELSRGTNLNGAVQFRADLGGTIESPDVSFLVDSTNLRVGVARDIAFHVAANYHEAELRLDRSEIVWQDQELSTVGTVNFDTEGLLLDLEARGRSISVQQVLALLGRRDSLAGRIDFSADISGRASNPSATVVASASGLEAYGEPLGRLSAETQLTDQRLEVSQFSLQKPVQGGPDGSVRGSGSYNLESGEYSIEATGDGLSLQHLALSGEHTLRGKLAFSANGFGSRESHSLELQVDAGELALGGRSLGSVSLSGKVTGEQAAISLRAPQLNLESDAQVRLSAPYLAGFGVSTNQTDLSLLKLPGIGGKTLAGILSGQIQGSGELSNWRMGNAAAKIQELRVAIAGEEIRNEGLLEAHLSDGVVEFVSARLIGADSEMTIVGSLPLERSSEPGNLQIRAELDPAKLLSFTHQDDGWEASGIVEVNASLQGSLEQLDPSLEMHVRDSSLSQIGTPLSLHNIEVSARTRGGTFVLENARAGIGSGQISAEGSFPLKNLQSMGLPLSEYAEDGPIHLQVRVEELRLETLGVFPEDVTGEMGLTLQAESPALDLDAVQADVQFDVLNLRLAGVDVRQSEPVQLSLRGGQANVDSFHLTGPGTSLVLQGQARWTEPTSLDLNLEGNADVGVLTLLRESLRASGDTQIELAVRGTLDEPRLSGTVALSQGRFALAEPALRADQLSAQIRVTPGRIAVESLSGTLNGGEVTGSGTFGYSSMAIDNVAAELSARDLFLNLPEGLRTSSEADLRLTTNGDQIVVGGEVRIIEGSFRNNLALEGELLAFLRSDQAAVLGEEERNPLLSRLRYNLPLRTISPIIVDNNLARLSATANLRIVGTYYRPSVTGRLDLEEGGELHLAENDYVIDTGSVDFLNPNRIEPSVNVVARTAASGYDIELRLTGTSDNVETTLTSEPPLPEPDIVSVLITGRTLEEARSSGVNVAAEQGLSYVTGRVGTRLSERAQETIGLSQVRIEPNLIAPESDPTVRLTLGQDLTRRLRLIYSMNLADSGDQIYVAEYGIGRRFNASGVKQSDNTYRFGFRHDVRAGGTPQAAQPQIPERTLGEITLTGNHILEPPTLLDLLDVSTGNNFDFLKLRDGLNQIEKRYREEQFLEARVRPQQERNDAIVNLHLNIEAGPKVIFQFEGISVPGNIRDQVAEDWQRGVFDAQRVQDAQESLRRWLVDESYLDASVEHEVQKPSQDLKRVIFRILPGARYENRRVLFEGVSALSSSELEKFLRDQQLIPAIYLEPARIVDSIAAYYRRKGYLEAQVQPPHHEREPDTRMARAVITVKEGPQYAFSDPTFEGNLAFSEEQLRANIPVQAGTLYSPEQIRSSIDGLEDLYWGAGYNNVLIEFSEQQDASHQQLLLRFRITENQQDVVGSVEIRGNDAVSESFIRKQIPFRKGDLFDFNRTVRARTDLYSTGAFAYVDFDSEPVQTATDGSQRPLHVVMNVQELRPYRLRYGGFFDTERGPGAILDFENRNTLGSARVVGIRTRYDSEIHEIRGYFGQPLRLGGPSTISATGFQRREIMAREFVSDFVTDRTGFSLQQEFRIGNHWLFNYGYRFERTHTFDREPDPNCPLPLDDPFCRFDDAFNVAPLTSSITWDSRDDLLDATRGMFTTHSLEYATEPLGSDLRFIRYFGQFYRYVPLLRSAPSGFNRPPGRPRLVYAGGVRTGLGRGFGGQGLILSERFFSGGGTTVRGFEQNTVGPKDFLGDPAGGDAMLVINNELRFPLISIFDGVAFLDLGNVYPGLSDFDPFEVRKAAGLGLRVRTPYFLLRMDYGRKLDRREGESAGELFFSIGQAF